MDEPHSGQMDNGLLFELQQQNEFLKRQLACSEAARERLEEARTLFHPDSLRAAAGPERLNSFESQTSITDNKTRYNHVKDWGEEPEQKHDRFAVLEWLIRE